MGAGVYEVCVLPGFGLIESKGDRLVGRPARVFISAGKFEVARMRFSKPNHNGIAGGLGLMQGTILVFPVLPDNFPNLWLRFFEVVLDFESGRLFRR